MKKNSFYFIIANVVGIILLILTSAHFKTPVFGWVISGAIVVVYAVGMERYRKVYLHLAGEEDLLEQYNAQQQPEPLGSGVIGDRIRRVKELTFKGVPFDAKAFSEILSARESVTMNRSPGGIVVLLGLAGTFYGLMVAITQAGSSLDVNNTNTTLSAIHSIFSSMNGIFGTSFCGLVAALFLNSTHSFVSSRKLAYMADVEEYTQFRLIPAFAPKGDNSEELRRNALVEQLSQVVSSMQTNLQTQLSAAVQSLSKNLEEVTRTSMERVEKAESGVLVRLEAIQQKASEGISQAITTSMASVEQSTQVLLDRVGKASAESIAKQTEQSQVQWTAALETVRAAMLQNAEQGKAAMDSILKIGAQVAELSQRVSDQADTRAVALAQNVGAQVEQLAKDVQASFTMLAQASRELVDSQRVLLEEIQKRQDRERELAEGLQAGVGEAGTLMRINQSEFQASLELFRQGVESLLEKYSGGSAEQENQRTFIDQLTATLEAFSEKASEVLVENAMRTQEILLEVLEQTRVSGQQTEQG